jgi:hypothetical protein
MERKPFALSLSKGARTQVRQQGFDRLSPNGKKVGRLEAQPGWKEGRSSGGAARTERRSVALRLSPDGKKAVRPEAQPEWKESRSP